MPPRGRGYVTDKKIDGKSLMRLLKYVFSRYAFRLIVVGICLIISSVASVIAATFMQRLIDEVIIPAGSDEAHYKAMITIRNRWMVDNSDYIITYVHSDYGGAYQTLEYAKKKKKINIIEIPKYDYDDNENQDDLKGKSNFEKAVILMEERWLDSLDPMEEYIPSERMRVFMKDLFSKFENKDNNGSSD